MGFFDFIGKAQKDFGEAISGVSKGKGVFSFLLNDEEKKREEERRAKLEEQSKTGEYDKYGNFIQPEKPGVLNAIGESLGELGTGLAHQATRPADIFREESAKFASSQIDKMKIPQAEKDRLKQDLESKKKTAADLSQGATDVIASIPGSMAQAVASAPLKIMHSLSGDETPTSKDELGRFFFGDKDVKTVGEYGRETAGMVTEPLGMKKEDINPLVAAGIGAGLIVGDLAYTGGGKKGVEAGVQKTLGALSKADSAASVLGIMKKTEGLKNISDDVAKQIAPTIAKIKDKNSIQRILGSAVRESEAAIDTGKQAVGGVNLGKIIPQKYLDAGEAAVKNDEAIKAAQTADYNAQMAARQAEEGQAALDEMIKGRAEQLQGMHKEGKNTLFNDIKSLGGIQSYRDGQLAEEMSGLPIGVRNKTGRPIDEIVDELNGMGHGIEDSNDLLARLSDYKRTTKSKEEFMEEARQQLMHGNDEEAEMFRATQEMMAPVADNAPRMAGQADEMVQPGVLPQTEQLLLEAPKPKTYTPGQAKRQVRANNATVDRLTESGMPLEQVDEVMTGRPRNINEQVVNKLPDNTRAIQLPANADELSETALHRTPSGNLKPVTTKAGTSVDELPPGIAEDMTTTAAGGSANMLHDPQRLIDRTFKKGSKTHEWAQKIFVDNWREAKRPYVEAKEATVKQFEDLRKSLGIKRVKDDVALREYGEGKLTREQVVARYGEAKAQAWDKALPIFREKYDDLLNQVNEVLKRTGKDPIPRRDDYFTHIQQISESGDLGKILDSGSGALADVRGGYGLSFAKKRMGDGSKATGAFEGFYKYNESALRKIHLQDQTDAMKQAAKHLKEMAKMEEIAGKSEGHLGRFLTQINNRNTVLEGSDRILLDKLFSEHGGEGALKAIGEITGRISKNTILGNPSSTLAQILGLVASPSESGTINTILGALDGITGVVSKGSEIAKARAKSVYLKERFMKDTEQITKTALGGASQTLQKPFKRGFEAVDQAINEAVWNAAWHKARKAGLAGEDAIREADRATGKIIGARGLGDKAGAFDTVTGNTALQYQLEVNNLWQLAKEYSGTARGQKMDPAKLAKFVVSTYVMNTAFEQITGRRPLPDAIDTAIKAGQDIAENPTDVESYKKAGGRVAGEVLGAVPGGQTITSVLGEDFRKEYLGNSEIGRYSGTIPIAEVARDVAGLAVNPAKSASDLAATVGMPFAGKPSQRFLNAGIDYQRGYTETPKGEVKYQTGDMGDFIKSALFGQNATAEGKNYYDNQLKQLSPKQSAYIKKTVAQQRNNPDKEEAKNITEATFKYFQTRQKAVKNANKKEYSSMITEAIGKGDKAKARQLAREYNTKVAKEFKDYGKQHGRYAQKEIASDYKKMFIRLNSQSISRRMKSYKQSNYEETTR